jgi:hypothetical protein
MNTTMDDENKNIPLKMYFTTNEIKKNILNKENASTEYIILQNNRLHMYVKTLENSLNDLETEKNNANDEVDSLTKTRTCLQGYMKNEVEYAVNWKSVAQIYNDQLLKYYNICIKSLILSYIYMILITICPFQLNIKIPLTTIYMTTLAYYTGKNLTYIYHAHTKCDVLLKLKEEITKIEKNNMYIQDLIDNI